MLLNWITCRFDDFFSKITSFEILWGKRLKTQPKKVALLEEPREVLEKTWT